MRRTLNQKRGESAGDGNTGREQGVLVDLDDDRVFAGLGEGEVADFVDEIDPLQRALGFERALDERLHAGGLEPHGDLDRVFAGGDVAEREKPHHERVHDGELASADVGEHAENGVFSGAGVDVDTVAGQPGEDLGSGVHL